MEWTFEVPGPPVAKERPRRAPAGHWYTPKRTVDYETTVADYARVAGLKLEAEKHYALEVALHLSTFRRDRDNCVKSIQDGLQRMGKPDWDDRQIYDLVVRTVSVRDGGEEKAVVTVREVG